MSKYPEFDLKGATRIPFAERETKVDVEMFGRPDLDADSFAAWVAKWEKILNTLQLSGSFTSSTALESVTIFITALRSCLEVENKGNSFP